jgi:hypothetical protein
MLEYFFSIAMMLPGSTPELAKADWQHNVIVNYIFFSTMRWGRKIWKIKILKWICNNAFRIRYAKKRY